MTPYWWMLISAAAFACMSELAADLKHECHWIITALARTALAFVFTGGLALARKVPLYFWRPRTLWFRSLTGSVSLLCTFYAFKLLPASDVIALTNMFPIWVAVFSWPLLGERPSPIVWIAVLASVSGTWLINMQNLGTPVAGVPVSFGSGGVAGAWFLHQPSLRDLTAGAATSAKHWGVVTATVSSVLSALVVIGLNKLHRLPSQAIVVHFSGVATVFCLAAILAAASSQESTISSNDFHLGAGTIVKLLALGISATIGQIFLTKAFAAGSAAKVAVVALSQVVMCLVFELGFRLRDFHWLSILGMMLIVGPTAWMLLRRDVSRLSTATAMSNETTVTTE
jgi:drug/metabolite transporter (DMT)-like permease